MEKLKSNIIKHRLYMEEFKMVVKRILTLLAVCVLSVAVVGCKKDEAVKESSANEPAVNGAKSSTWSVERPEGVPVDFPKDDIEWIYAFGPGSAMDAYVRVLGETIQKNEGWKHGIVVTYKEGASGRVGWNAFAKSKADGYTLGFTPSAMLISSVSEDVSYGVDKMSFIFNAMSDPGAIGVGANSKYKTFQDLIADAKANPGKITMGVTSEIGSEGLTIKMLEKAAGVDFNMVAYNSGSEVMTAILGNHLDAFCLNVTDTTTFVEDKTERILATGANERSEFLPDVPTYKEAGYDVTQVNMRGICAPKGLDEPTRQYLENCFIAAANEPEVKAKAAEMKIPLDSLNGAEMQAIFTKLAEGYAELYKSDPWQ